MSMKEVMAAMSTRTKTSQGYANPTGATPSDANALTSNKSDE
jgi:hypothetical protein